MPKMSEPEVVIPAGVNLLSYGIIKCVDVPCMISNNSRRRFEIFRNTLHNIMLQMVETIDKSSDVRIWNVNHRQINDGIFHDEMARANFLRVRRLEDLVSNTA